jgi:hypothetical protein
MMGPTVINPSIPTGRGAAYWQLALLACTSVALSIASGWTTWDGMRNFTDNPVLSLLITFGIQGVMLIAAWLIGETFVGNGGEAARDSGRGRRTAGPLGISLAAFTALFVVVLVLQSGALPATTGFVWPWLVIAFAVAFGAVFWTIAIRGRSVGSRPAEAGPGTLRTLVRHALLWIMFVTCLIASVFFSFDSLFDTLFSPEERRRASHTRVQAEVATLLTGLSNEVAQRRLSAITELFSSANWSAYDRALSELAARATQTAANLRVDQDTAQRRSEEEIAVQHRTIAAAEARLRSLDTRIAVIKEELGANARAVEAAQERVQARNLELIARRTQRWSKGAEAQAEEAGAGVTGIAGRGPKFREIKQEEAQLKISESLAEKLVEDAQREHALRIAKRDQLLAQLQELEVESGNHRNEIETAKLRLAALRNGSSMPLLESSARNLESLNDAKIAFLAAPTAESLRELQRRCVVLAGTLASAVHSAAAAAAACDAKGLNELTGPIFDANAARDAYARECGSTGFEGLDTEELLHLGQRCLQIAAVQNAATASFQARLRQTSLQRDDRAHRFIVTWNAFFDRNQLAFVALFIAFAMDGLIFMSGLYGASARAELAASAAAAANKRLRASTIVLDAALMPDPAERARLALESIDFSRSGRGAVGEVDLAGIDASRIAGLRAVLNAAMVIGLARPSEHGGRYAIHPNLIELLSGRIDRALAQGSGATLDAVPSDLLRLSLGYDGQAIIQLLLRAARPLPPDQEFTHEIEADWLPRHAREQLLAVLNAGIAEANVAVESHAPDRYLLRPAFFLALVRAVSAETPRIVDASAIQPAAAPDAMRALDKPAPSLDLVDSNETSSAPVDSPEQQPIALEPQHAEGSSVSARAGERADLVSRDADRADVERRPAMATAENRPPAPVDPRPAPLDGTTPPHRHRRDATIMTAKRGQSDGDRRRTPTLVALHSESNNRVPPRFDPDRPISLRARSLNEDAPAHVELPDELLVALHRATGLSKAEIARLADPRTSFAYAAACKALQSLRESHDKLDRTLQQLERAIWTRIHGFVGAGPVSARSAADALSGAARKQMARCFPRIFLRWRGLREAQLWCDSFVAEHEVLAQTAGIPAADAQRLRQIARNIPVLIEADDLNRSAWEDLLCRIKGLCETVRDSSPIEELMP